MLFRSPEVFSISNNSSSYFTPNQSINFIWGNSSNQEGLFLKKLLTSRSHNEYLAQKLDLFVNYSTKGRLKSTYVDKDDSPVFLVIDKNHPQVVNQEITLIPKSSGKYEVVLPEEFSVNHLYDYNAEEFKRTLDVNVVGAFNCSKRVYKHMLDQEYGRIINISSTNGINTYYPMCIDYDASKAALISMTHNLAAEFGPYINVNCVAPGFIGTDNELDGYDEEFLKEETEKIMVKRYGKPEEVAYLVRFLISDEANFINNSIIRIDGGQMGSC